MTIPAVGKPEARLGRLGGAHLSGLAALACFAIAVLSLAGATMLGAQASLPRLAAAVPSAGVTLRVGSGEAPLYTVAPGGEITVPVEVVDASELGAATVLLSYDPAMLQVVTCTAAEPPDADISLCNPTYGEGVTRYSLVASAGLSDTHRLFTVTFRATGGDGATAQLTLAAPQFLDTLGASLPVTTTGGEIAIDGASLPPDASVRLVAPDNSLVPGTNLVVGVTVAVTEARPLAAATFLLQYDPQVVRPVQCVRAPASGLLGGCNPNFNTVAGLIKFNVLDGAGASGLLPLYDITFEAAPAAAVGATSPLTLTVATMLDTTSAVMRWQAEHGSVTIVAGPATAAQVLVGAPSGDGIFTLDQGAVLSVPVWITDVVNLGAATIALDFDPALVQPLGCAVHAELSDGGHCSIRSGQVQANLVVGQGITGSLPVFDVFFTPVAGAPSGLNSPLTLDVTSFLDARSAPLPWRVRPGRLDIGAGDAALLPLVSVAPGTTGAPLPLARDGQVTVTLSISEVVNLGAATIAVHFDPAVVTAVACLPGGVIGGSSCIVGKDAVTVSLLTAAGFTGSAPVLMLVFRSADHAVVGDQTALVLAVPSLYDVTSKPLRYQLANSMLVIAEPVGAPVQAFLHFSKAVYHTRPGELIWVSFQATLDPVAMPQGLDLVTLVVDYDPAVLRPVACVVNDSAFLGGGCNLAYGADQIRFSLIGGAGVTGGVPLVEIQFETIGQRGDVSHLAPVVAQLLGVGAITPAYRVAPSQVEISTDGDGVPDLVEGSAPNGGDGNGDGIPDLEQSHVTSLPSTLDNRYVTIVAPPPACLKNVAFVDNPSPADTPYGWAFPLGMIRFSLNCIAPGHAAIVAVLLHDNGALQLEHFFVYTAGGTPPNAGWQPFLLENGTGAVFVAERIHLHLTDGLRGDSDRVRNGAIEFLGGPARPGAAVSVFPQALSVVEGGEPAGYRVTLLARPAAPVTITMTTAGQTVVTPARLDFALADWSVAQTVTVSALADAVGEGIHHDEVRHTLASADSLYDGLVAPSVAVTITDVPDPTPTPPPTRQPRAHLPLVLHKKPAHAWRVYLPLVVRTPLPDLRVAAVRWVDGAPQVIIENAGDAPVVDSFWVELYINPHTVPTAVNQTWDLLGAQGLVWGVDGAALPLLPGQRLTLMPGDAYNWPEYSLASFPLAPGTPIYVQVDSASDGTSYGGVLEADEQVGQPYNNIFGPAVAPAIAGGAHAWTQPATAAHIGVSTLPPRPRRRSRVQPVRNTRRLPDAA